MVGSGSGPVNLNRFRKEKVRAATKARADENAAKFGRTKSQKAVDSTKITRARRLLDGHKRDPETE